MICWNEWPQLQQVWPWTRLNGLRGRVVARGETRRGFVGFHDRWCRWCRWCRFSTDSSVQGAPVAHRRPTKKGLWSFFIVSSKNLRTVRIKWYCDYYGVQETVHGKRSDTKPKQREQSRKMPNKRPEDWHDPRHRYFLTQPNNQNPKTILFAMDVAPQNIFSVQNCWFTIGDWTVNWWNVTLHRKLCGSGSSKRSTQGNACAYFHTMIFIQPILQTYILAKCVSSYLFQGSGGQDERRFSETLSYLPLIQPTPSRR